MPKCSATRNDGQPCSAHAIRNTNPPLCAAHGQQSTHPPLHNQNARRSGFYSPVLNPTELADLVACSGDTTLNDEIACARVVLRRLLAILDAPLAQAETPEHPEQLTPDTYTRISGLALQAARTIARLLRDQRALSGAAADGIAGAIATALDELSTEWGIEL